ncbi:MAG: RNA methyltransferase, partial [Anaerolineae bacterium]|nr:RNA methyltransferase [Anaerolineae bacterium]
PVADDAYKRAKHGRSILENARTVKSLSDILPEADLLVATTGIATKSEKAFHRQALTPWELAAKLQQVDGLVYILLGREDYGLYNEELEMADVLVNVPCSPDHPIMNVSHAATILFYEVCKGDASSVVPERRLASGYEKERLYNAFGELLTDVRYPQHKRRRTEVMFRRLMGRATPTKWEFYALMGVIRGASKTIRRLSGSPG